MADVETPLVQEGIVDGISFWISGPSQRHISAQLTSLVGELREKLPAGVPIFTGGYITYSSIGWTEPGPFYDLLEQSISLYDANVVQGFYAFAGSVLHSMNQTLWQTWDLPGHLSESYFPHLGRACVTVTAGTAGAGGAGGAPHGVATVVYNGSTFVTRRNFSAADSLAAGTAAAAGESCSFAFGGWAGKAKPVPHTVTVVAAGYETATAQIQLTAGSTATATLRMTPTVAKVEVPGQASDGATAHERAPSVAARDSEPAVRAAAHAVQTSVPVDCGVSDANLLFLRQRICSSLTQAHTSWCGDSWRNVSKSVAHEDWPSQATYMHAMVAALASPRTCLNTSYARDTVAWMERDMANQTLSGSLMWTWLVFQVGYYDTPMPPTAPRIESASTLGRKCWAFAYLKELWQPTTLAHAVEAAGLHLSSFISQYERAVPLTFALCEKVLHNCFLNASVAPRPPCPASVTEFHFGFERENILRHNIAKYTFNP